MSENSSKNPNETPKGNLTKDYGVFGKLEVIDIAENDVFALMASFSNTHRD